MTTGRGIERSTSSRTIGFNYGKLSLSSTLIAKNVVREKQPTFIITGIEIYLMFNLVIFYFYAVNVIMKFMRLMECQSGPDLSFKDWS